MLILSQEIEAYVHVKMAFGLVIHQTKPNPTNPVLTWLPEVVPGLG